LGAFIFTIPFALLRWWLSKPKVSISIPERGANEPAIHPKNGIAFYHLLVENKGKNTATDAELKISFKDENETGLFSLKGKWDSGPEPIGPIVNNKPTPMPSLIPFAERINIRKKLPESFCLVIKDNQSFCYAFNCDSYFHGFKKRNWRLPPGNFIVEVEVKGGNAEKKQRFLLRNTGNTIHDIEIQKL